MTANDKPLHERRIRSFVRREGRLTAGQQRALDKLWPRFGLEAGRQLDLDAVFGRRAPRTLEIGFGNGASLAAMAENQPDCDFIGIEVHRPGIGRLLLELESRGLENVRIFREDAIQVLHECLPDNSLDRLLLFFPDPWPKKRHHKRRILQPAFLQLCAERLVAGGSLHIATDWANYAEHIDAVFSGAAAFACAERREHDGDAPLDRPMTKFERRGLGKGHRIWDWRFDLLE